MEKSALVKKEFVEVSFSFPPIYRSFLRKNEIISIGMDGSIYVSNMNPKNTTYINRITNLKSCDVSDNGLVAFGNKTGEITLFSITKKELIGKINHDQEMIIDLIFFKRREGVVALLLVLKHLKIKVPKPILKQICFGCEELS